MGGAEAVAPAVSVTVTVCAVPPVSVVVVGLNEQVTCVAPVHASVTGSTKSVVAFSVAVKEPLPPLLSEAEVALSEPLKSAT
jgi:hypothetical protein